MENCCLFKKVLKSVITHPGAFHSQKRMKLLACVKRSARVRAGPGSNP